MEILRGAGFSLEMSHHAIHVLGSRMLGFTQDPFDDSATRDRIRRRRHGSPANWASTFRTSVSWPQP